MFFLWFGHDQALVEGMRKPFSFTLSLTPSVTFSLSFSLFFSLCFSNHSHPHSLTSPSIMLLTSFFSHSLTLLSLSHSLYFTLL